MIHDEGPRPLIDGEEISWVVRSVVSILVLMITLPVVALAIGVLAGIAALGFERVYGG